MLTPLAWLSVCLFLHSSLGNSRWLTKDELQVLLVETISPHDVRPLPVLFFSQNIRVIEPCGSSSVRSLPAADGASAVAAIQLNGGGVCSAVPPPAGGPVQETDHTPAAARRQGRGLQHRRRYEHWICEQLVHGCNEEHESTTAEPETNFIGSNCSF